MMSVKDASSPLANRDKVLRESSNRRTTYSWFSCAVLAPGNCMKACSNQIRTLLEILSQQIAVSYYVLFKKLQCPDLWSASEHSPSSTQLQLSTSHQLKASLTTSLYGLNRGSLYDVGNVSGAVLDLVHQLLLSGRSVEWPQSHLNLYSIKKYAWSNTLRMRKRLYLC